MKLCYRMHIPSFTSWMKHGQMWNYASFPEHLQFKMPKSFFLTFNLSNILFFNS